MFLPKTSLPVALVLCAVTAFLAPNATLGALALCALLLGFASTFGARVDESFGAGLRAFFGVCVGVALVAVFGAALYYAFPVTALGLFAVLALVSAIAFFVSRGRRLTFALPAFPRDTATIVFVVIFALALVGWWNVVLGVPIVNAVRSPWLAVPPEGIVALMIAFCAASALVVRPRSRTIGTVALFGVLASALSMAAVVYPLGYGFDPFLHRATVEHIATYGTITPKPLYYIGEYAIELTLVKLFALPLFSVDVALAPILGALAFCILAVSGTRSAESRFAVVALCALAPLSFVVSTTPQAIGNIFLVLTLAVVILADRERRNVLALGVVFAAAALVTHPLAGVPAALLVAFAAVQLFVQEKRMRRALGVALALGALCAIPLLFTVEAALAHTPITFTFEHIADMSRLGLTSFVKNHFAAAGDGAYLFLGNMPWLGILLGLFATGTLFSRETRFRVPGILAAALVVNFLALALLYDFDYLIAYERADYANRLLALAFLLTLPALAACAERMFDEARRIPYVAASMIALAALVVGANVYGAYPRHDAYARSAGFNVSEADKNAVALIHEREADGDYVVLANQAVAAAAVEAYGFQRYYHGDMFYYPIPTGGELYTLFLSMVNDGPTRDTAVKAMDAAGVSTLYFVVNDYWWQSDAIIENAKTNADDWVSVDEGKVTVFRYVK